MRFATVVRVLTALACMAGAAVVPASGRTDEQALRPGRLRFVSGGKTVLVDAYEPVGAGDHPSALVLHGAGGMLFDGPEMQRVGAALAGSGTRAYVVHYFDGSGVTFTTSDRILNDHYGGWLAVIRDAVNLAQARQVPGHHHRPVGIYGYSMGAFLGIAASSDNPKVGALAEQAGGAWDTDTSRIDRMPPVLMIHGRDDRRVPFEKFALPLQAALRKRGNVVETLFIDHEGHGFSAPAQARARAAAAAFIQQQIGGRKLTVKVGKPGHPGGNPTN